MNRPRIRICLACCSDAEFQTAIEREDSTYRVCGPCHDAGAPPIEQMLKIAMQRLRAPNN